jgi:hypothetical protein
LRSIDNLEWITGFVDGEGSFGIFIAKAPVSTGYSVMLRFTITQHVKDHKLVESLVNYFDCGWVFVDTNKPIVHFIVSNFSDIKKKIIPFFLKYSLESAKSLDFNDFIKAAKLIESKDHLTEEGLEQIRSIKLKMNRGRK